MVIKTKLYETNIDDVALSIYKNFLEKNPEKIKEIVSKHLTKKLNKPIKIDDIKNVEKIGDKTFEATIKNKSETFKVTLD